MLYYGVHLSQNDKLRRHNSLFNGTTDRNVSIARRVRKFSKGYYKLSHVSVCHIEHLSSYGRDVHELRYLRIFLKSVEEVQVWFTSDKNNGRCIGIPATIMIISRWILLKMKNILGKFVKKIKTHFILKKHFPRKAYRLWDNGEKYGTAIQTTFDNIIRWMRFACWITKTTDTHSE